MLTLSLWKITPSYIYPLERGVQKILYIHSPNLSSLLENFHYQLSCYHIFKIIKHVSLITPCYFVAQPK